MGAMEERYRKYGETVMAVSRTLKPPSKDLNNPSQLGKANNLTVWDVADVNHSRERDHVVLAHRMKLNVLLCATI
jgi:hypothetical protein